jgi:hypothetical protein
MKTTTSPLFAIILIAICTLPIRAEGQNNAKKSAPAASATAACPAAKELTPPQIHGRWRARFNPAPAGMPADATMLIERHAEFSESVAGAVIRVIRAPKSGGHAPRAQLAGDLENGLLTLDESSNGISITGTWNGEMVEGSCGKKFSGMWKDTSNNAPTDAPDVPFTLEKLPGW